MKKKLHKFKTVLIILLTHLFISSSVASQTPEKMSYQAVIRNSSDAIIANSQVGMKISILQGSINGSTIYTETQTPFTNANGLISIKVGDKPDFNLIDWFDGPYFIKTETDPTGGTNYIITGTSQLLSVPYALHAKSAESITNLANPVNAQDVATKAYVDILEAKINLINNTLNAGGKVTDYEGESYNTVKIGTQIWMSENLKVNYLNDGTEIPLIIEDSEWEDLGSPAYCWYNNDHTTYSNSGAIYNWHVVNTGKLCPTGWHVPTDQDWYELSNYLGGDLVAGGKLKEIGTTNWDSPNTGATNSIGFTALPSSNRSSKGVFGKIIGNNSVWWSATEDENNDKHTWCRSLYYDQIKLSRYSNNKNNGFSVRCIKD